MTEHKEFTFFTEGIRGTISAIGVTIYPQTIVAVTEQDWMTNARLKKAMAAFFPDHSFEPVDIGYGYLRADAFRFDGDGADEIFDHDPPTEL